MKLSHYLFQFIIIFIQCADYLFIYVYCSHECMVLYSFEHSQSCLYYSVWLYEAMSLHDLWKTEGKGIRAWNAFSPVGVIIMAQVQQGRSYIGLLFTVGFLFADMCRGLNSDEEQRIQLQAERNLAFSRSRGPETAQFCLLSTTAH